VVDDGDVLAPAVGGACRCLCRCFCAVSVYRSAGPARFPFPRDVLGVAGVCGPRGGSVPSFSSTSVASRQIEDSFFLQVRAGPSARTGHPSAPTPSAVRLLLRCYPERVQDAPAATRSPPVLEGMKGGTHS
jgi:hypothetical protein